MKNRWVWVGVLLVAAAIVVWQVRTPPTESGIGAEPLGQPASQPAQSPGTEPTDATSPRSGADIANLRAALALATERREEAERALDAFEVELDELEAFVDEIEARGEDPVDYADEGLAQFQPSFARYEAAFAALEEAELVEQLARAALAEATAQSQ